MSTAANVRNTRCLTSASAPAAAENTVSVKPLGMVVFVVNAVRAEVVVVLFFVTVVAVVLIFVTVVMEVLVFMAVLAFVTVVVVVVRVFVTVVMVVLAFVTVVMIVLVFVVVLVFVKVLAFVVVLVFVVVLLFLRTMCICDHIIWAEYSARNPMTHAVNAAHERDLAALYMPAAVEALGPEKTCL